MPVLAQKDTTVEMARLYVAVRDSNAVAVVVASSILYFSHFFRMFRQRPPRATDHSAVDKIKPALCQLGSFEAVSANERPPFLPAHS